MTDRIDEINALRSAAQVIAWKTRPSAADGAHYILELGCDESPVATVRGEHNARLIAAAPELLGWAVAEIERGRNVQRSLRDWAQGRAETLTRCIAIKGVDPRAESEMMYERTIMRDIVAMLDEVSK